MNPNVETPEALYRAISQKIAHGAHVDPPGHLASSLPHAHELLKHSNVQNKVQGLRMFASLSKRGDFGVCCAALEYLEHPSYLVRQHAATALGKAADVGDQRIVQRLVRLLEDQPGYQGEAAREAAIEAISEIGDGTTMQKMLSYLRPGPAQESFILQASSLQILEKLASKGDEQVVEVVRSKLDFGVARRIQAVASNLDLEGPDRLRAAAFHALAMLAHPSDSWIATIHELLTAEKAPIVRAAAVRALGKMSEKDNTVAIDAFCRIARDDKDDVHVREAALNALARIASKGNSQAVQTAIASAGSHHSSLREVASEALVQLVDRGDHGAVDAFLESVSNNEADCDILAGAFLALSQLAAVGDHRVVEAAHHVLRGDDAIEVRKAALHTLVAIADGRDQYRTVQAACYLAEGGPNNNAGIVEQALETLTLLCPSMKKDLAAPVMTVLFCMCNENPSVRAAACDCIGVIAPPGNRRVTEELAGLLQDSNSLVRLAAVRALFQLGTLQDDRLDKAIDACSSARRLHEEHFENSVAVAVNLALGELRSKGVISQICCTCF